MTDEHNLIDDALAIARSKFDANKRIPAERRPIIDVLPWSPDFGPHICVRCNGAGFMVDRSEQSYGMLVACVSCDKANTQRLPRCWSVSSMSVSAPNPPRITTFEPYTDEAGTVIDAVGAFIRERFGWLTLYGASGTGKSHIIEAIARYLLAANIPCVYITSTELWEYLGGVERGHEAVDYAERFRWVASLPGLAIDELNVESRSEFVFKTRRALLDARYRGALNGESVTVIASNDAPAQWQDGAVADRALDARFACVYSGSKSYRQVTRERGAA